MIFVNRHRIIQNSGVIKDPTKYWYIEKYVYGVLKETVEVPLRTSTTFSAIDSGYVDDIFYGWSISSTSTSRTFTDTASYSNTTSTVKSYLDSENTIKIYAIYQYATVTKCPSISGTRTYTFIMKEDGELSLSGYATTRTLVLDSGGNTVSDTTSTSAVTFYIYDSNNNEKERIAVYKNTQTTEVVAGDKISITVINNMSMPSTGSGKPPSGTYGGTSTSASILSTGDMYDWSVAKYRVESHT